MEMISPKEFSELTSIPIRTITRLASQGQIPAVKVGRQWRFIREDVERWLRTQASNQKHRVLVVDDDEELLQLVRVLVGRLGNDVVTAPGGPQALEVLKKDPDFDLVILDLQMPDVDGPDVMEWMSENGVDVDVMLFTAYPEGDLMARALKYRHVTMVKKPVDPEAFQRAVVGILGGVGARASVVPRERRSASMR